MKPTGRIFVLKLRALTERSDPIRELRWLLKRLLRAHRFQCIDIREVKTAETEKFDADDDIRKSVAVGFAEIRKRKTAGGPGWEPK